MSTLIASHEFLVLPESDEIPMTMQIAMVVGESIVLAGDLRWRFEPRLVDGQGWRSGMYGQKGTKIKIASDEKLAVSCADNMKFAECAAESILQSIREEPSPEEITRIVDSVSFPGERKTQLLIVSVRSTPKLFKYASWREGDKWAASCKPWYDLAIAGELVNPAIFWAEHYYKRVATTQEAIYLAAHLITCAGILNPAGIEGLEIAVCGPSGIQLLPKDEISALEAQARKNDERIGKIIVGNSALS